MDLVVEIEVVTAMDVAVMLCARMYASTGPKVAVRVEIRVDLIIKMRYEQCKRSCE